MEFERMTPMAHWASRANNILLKAMDPGSIMDPLRPVFHAIYSNFNDI